MRAPDTRAVAALSPCGVAATWSLPVLGAVLSFLAWISVLVLHSGARYVGSAWMAGGIVLYVVYRKSSAAD